MGEAVRGPMTMSTETSILPPAPSDETRGGRHPLRSAARFVSRIAALRGWRADLAALGLGVLAALALPPIYALPVLLVAFPGLLALIDAAPGPVVAARRGWWFGFGLHLVGLYWITEAILIEAARFWWFVPIAVPALAATLAAFIAVAAGLARLARPGWPRVLALAGAWVLADLARQFIGTGFPWNLLGSVWEFPGWLGDVCIQAAALTSIHGLTLVTVVLALTPSLSWRWRGAGVAFLCAWAAFGIFRLQQPLPPAPGLNVVLVQGNVAEGQKWDRSLLNSIFERYLRLTAEGIARSGSGPAVVVWPETASPFLLQTDALARQYINEAAKGAPALVGALRFDSDGRLRNSLFALSGTGSVVATYDKWHLVPFGEYQPSWFPAGIQIVPGGGLASGPGPRTLHVPGLPPVGPFICYEAIFPGQVVDNADRPAWMVNITNDAWFGDSSGPRQHLAAARIRAAEEGLPLLRAANTGITAAFDAHGHELARLARATPGVLVVPLPAALPPTPFARLGLIIPFLLASGVLAIGLLAGWDVTRWSPGRLGMSEKQDKNRSYARVTEIDPDA
jgi:apolipoprotein N-acyltransferase